MDTENLGATFYTGATAPLCTALCVSVHPRPYRRGATGATGATCIGGIAPLHHLNSVKSGLWFG